MEFQIRTPPKTASAACRVETHPPGDYNRRFVLSPGLEPRRLRKRFVLAEWRLVFVYCCAIVAFSVCGGAVTSVLRMTHTWLQLLVSFVGGLMLGVGILHQWPHAAALLVETDPALALNWSAGWLMAGL